MCTIQNYKVIIYMLQIINEKLCNINSNSSGKIKFNSSEREDD